MIVAVSIALALGFVVFVHELGHFVCCKWLRIKVLRFAFGFGPEVAGFTRGETRYSICAFPLGGFVKPAGEDPEEVTGDPDEFFSKSWEARIAVALAGPAMNYALALGLFLLVFTLFGTPEYSKGPDIGLVLSGSPAQDAGMKTGDRVLRIFFSGDNAGAAVATWEDLSGLIHRHPDESMRLLVDRQGTQLEVGLTSKKDPARGIGLIGIAPMLIYRKAGAIESFKMAGFELYRWSASSIVYIWEKLRHGEKPDLAGPVGIISMMNRAAHSGAAEFLALLAAISVAIGFFNLFPIPMLDGGHVALYLWEGISKHKLTRNFLIRANTIGLVILIPIFLFAFYNDIERLWLKRMAKVKTEFQEITAPVKP
ncbi:MAG: site-2 protease family protein [Elusimicrobia bacterium]|nr:site-2 protease family protein [Elusimicrobiota bacterium]